MGTNQLPGQSSSPDSQPNPVLPPNGFPSPNMNSPHPLAPQMQLNNLSNIPAHMLGSLTPQQQQTLNQHLQLARLNQPSSPLPAQMLQAQANGMPADPAAMHALQQRIYA
jgi:hypothetical protein